MENGDQTADVGTWYSNLAHGQWVKLPVAGRRPPGRYEVMIVSLSIGIRMVQVLFWVINSCILYVLFRMLEGIWLCG